MFLCFNKRFSVSGRRSIVPLLNAVHVFLVFILVMIIIVFALHLFSISRFVFDG